MALSAMTTVTDTAFLLHYGEKNVTYATVSESLVNIFLLLLVGYAVELTRNLKKDGFLNVSLLIYGLTISVLNIFILTIFGRYFIALFFDGGQEIALDYLKIFSLSTIGSLFIMTATGINRATNRPQRSLYCSAFVIFGNIILNFYFLTEGFPKENLVKVALSSTVSQVVVGIGYLCFTLFTSKIKFIFRSHSEIFKSILVGLERMFSMGSIQIVQKYFIAMTPIIFSTFYFSYERFLLPFLFIGYSFHEWVIVQKNSPIFLMKKVLLSIFSLTFFYLIYAIFLIFYLPFFSFYGYFITVFFVPFFWFERTLVGLMYASNKHSFVVRVHAMSKFFLIFLIVSIVYLLKIINGSLIISLIFVFQLFEIIMMLYLLYGFEKNSLSS